MDRYFYFENIRNEAASFQSEWRLSWRQTLINDSIVIKGVLLYTDFF